MLEPNNIYNGNSYELIKEIPIKSVDLVYIDVPYLIKHSKRNTTNSSISKRMNRLMNDDLNGITDDFDHAILDELCRVMKNIYIHGVQKIK